MPALITIGQFVPDSVQARKLLLLDLATIPADEVSLRKSINAKRKYLVVLQGCGKSPYRKYKDFTLKASRASVGILNDSSETNNFKLNWKVRVTADSSHRHVFPL